MARNLEFDEEEAIKKAMEVFWKKGYSGTSIRDLAGAMNIQVSSIYNTIGDKQQLFVRCIRSYTQSRMQDAKSNAATIKSPIQAITNFINGAAHTIIYGTNSCLAIKSTFEVAATDPAIQAILREDNEFTHQFLLGLIEKGIKLKQIKANTDANTLTDFILNTFTGWHESFILHKDPGKIKKMAKYLIDQITE
jgi:TetR/AcrR family transcriptional repressor of nem operon